MTGFNFKKWFSENGLKQSTMETLEKNDLDSEDALKLVHADGVAMLDNPRAEETVPTGFNTAERYGVISPPKIKLCSQLSSFSFKNYVYHFEINIRIQNRFFASNIISFLDNSHISITKTRTTFKFFIHQSTSPLSNKVLASTFILSSLTIKILQ